MSENTINLGRLAEQVLSNESYSVAWTLFQAKLINELKAASYKDVAEIQEIKRKMSTLDSVKSELEYLMANGQFEEKTLLQKAKMKLAG